jgi:putative ABC transport system permease protein
MTLFNDLNFALRGLRKHRSFTVAAVLTIALGIGLNTALFTVFDAFVMKPLPLKDPSTLVSLEGRDKLGQRRRLFSYLDYLDYQQQNPVFSDLIAWNKVSVTVGEAPPPDADDFTLAEGYEHLFGQIVSNNYFSALGVRMNLGHGFETQENSASEIVLSHTFWQRRFNSDPAIIGRAITLQGHPFTIIGVTEPGFIGTTPDPPSFWAPLPARDDLIQAGGWAYKTWLTNRDVEVFTLLGRLAPGVSRSDAEAAVQLTTARLAQKYPNDDRKTSLKLERAGTFVTLDEDLSALVLPLAIGFGLVLLVACANVANLLLARAIGRQREIGVRIALGAKRSHIIRQLLTESTLLALLGGAAGLLIAAWALRTAYPLILSAIPVPELATGLALNLSPDWRVFAFTLAIAAITGAVAGMAPAISMSRPDVVTALKDEVPLGHVNKSRLRSGLIVGQIAVSLSLLIGAGLLAINARRLQQVDTGMITHNVFSIAVGLSADDRQDNAKQIRLRQELADRLRAAPDVAAVSEAFNQPLSGNMGNRLVRLQGDEPSRAREARFNFVSAEYFQTLSIRLTKGRAFSADEVRSGTPVVVVSETAANQFWPGQDPLGQQLGVLEESAKEGDQTTNATYKPYQVVGVARDTRSRHVWQPDERFVYLPVPETKTRYLLVQTRGDLSATMSGVRSVAASIDPALRTSVRRLDDSLNIQTVPFRALAWVSGALGVLALVLAALGLYGVTSFLVARRTHEIGIRMALGARGSDVVALFLREGLRLTLFGIVLGIAGGVVLSRLLVSVLVDLSAVDPFVFALVSLFMVLVTTVAILAATRRATKVDPMVALRYE